MEKINIISNAQYKVGNIRKQRVNIGARQGKTFKQADIKKLVQEINQKYIKEKIRHRKYLFVVYLN